MNLIQRHIKWIMIMSGALTCTMIYAAIAPQAALRSTTLIFVTLVFLYRWRFLARGRV